MQLTRRLTIYCNVVSYRSPSGSPVTGCERIILLAVIGSRNQAPILMVLLPGHSTSSACLTFGGRMLEFLMILVEFAVIADGALPGPEPIMQHLKLLGAPGLLQGMQMQLRGLLF